MVFVGLFFIVLFCSYKSKQLQNETVHLFIRVIQTLFIEVLISLFRTGGINKTN